MARMEYETGMKTVNVNKDQLLTTLKENLSKHREDYVAANAGYLRTRAARLMDLYDSVSNAVQDNTEERFEGVNTAYNDLSSLRRPVDHSESYELAIDMVSWSADGVIELSVNDFQCYVRDNWDWKAGFRKTVTSYTSVNSTIKSSNQFRNI